MNAISELLHDKYVLSDILKIRSFLDERKTLALKNPSANGLFSASSAEDAKKTGYDMVWVRDNIYIAYAHYVTGKKEVAQKNVQGLIDYFGRYRSRFQCAIEQNCQPSSAMDRPHVRFDGMHMKETDEPWEHAQNDALAYFLWLACMLLADLEALPGKLCLDQFVLDVLILFPLYFKAIRFWQDEDSGHWEEEPKVEASSIGAVVAGLKQFRSLMLANLDKPFHWQYMGSQVTVDMVDELITLGESSLAEILPWECREPPQKQRRYDAALLFLIYPLEVVSESVAGQIIADVQSNLQGEFGISRYLNDTFWCQDFQRLPREIQTAKHSYRTDWLKAHEIILEPGSEAQWCIFDPILSSIYGSRYQSKHDPVDLQMQTYYLNRSLRQITSEISFIPMGETGKHQDIIPIPANRCPELYYLMEGHYVPNVSTPLLWTQANLMVALEMMTRSLSLPCP